MGLLITIKERLFTSKMIGGMAMAIFSIHNTTNYRSANPAKSSHVEMSIRVLLGGV